MAGHQRTHLQDSHTHIYIFVYMAQELPSLWGGGDCSSAIRSTITMDSQGSRLFLCRCEHHWWGHCGCWGRCDGRRSCRVANTRSWRGNCFCFYVTWKTEIESDKQEKAPSFRPPAYIPEGLRRKPKRRWRERSYTCCRLRRYSGW